MKDINLYDIVEKIEVNYNSKLLQKEYKNEYDGQIDFLSLFIKDEDLEKILIYNTDGIINGNILEFKKSSNSLNNPLNQSLIYLSNLRLNGIPVPKNILNIDLYDKKCYLYDSNDYKDYINDINNKRASKNNERFIENRILIREIDISNKIGLLEIEKILKQIEYFKVSIDKSNVAQWGQTYYRILYNLSNSIDGIDKKYDSLFTKEEKDKIRNKQDFKSFYLDNENGELRKPFFLKNFIEPYSNNSNNQEFKYIMDKLNDKISQKKFGAFFTPKPYCKVAKELVDEAIKNIKKGNDYIILDRCAGTGNLEEVLTEEQLKHTIVNTIEFYEYIELKNKLKDKILGIIPPDDQIKNNITINLIDTKTEKLTDIYLKNGDALTENFIKNADVELKNGDIKKLNDFVNNEKINIIMLENPPFSDETSNTNGKKAKDIIDKTKYDFIKSEMKNNNIKGANLNDFLNRFIFSATKYYLKKENDFAVFFSPVKYFKSVHLMNNLTFKKGYLLNRQYFHANPSAVSLILWQNIEPKNEEKEFNLKYLDIEENENYKEEQDKINNGKVKIINDLKNNDFIVIKKVYKLYSEVYFKNKKRENYIATINLSGFNLDSNSVGLVTSRDNIKGHGSCFYLRASSFNLDNNSVTLTTIPEGSESYSPHGKMIDTDNYKSKLPLFCAKLFPQSNWFERDVYFTTADKGEEYLKDNDFIKSCFIYTCLSSKNHCRSFYKLDNNEKNNEICKNELCFDKGTIASNDLEKYNKNDFNDFEKNMLNIWYSILNFIKKEKDEGILKEQEVEEYNKNFTYGLYQIKEEINIDIQKTDNGNLVYDKKRKPITEKKYKKLNDLINELEKMLKEYYKLYIQEKLFKYELLK